MKYLVLEPQYTAAPLRDEFDGASREWPIELDTELKRRVEAWNDRCLKMIADDDPSTDGQAERAAVNNEALSIVSAIGAVYDVKIKYTPE